MARKSRKYGKKASETVSSALRRFKRGTLKTRGGRKVTTRKQAIAIGLSEARQKGYKVPAPSRTARHHATRKKYPYIAYWENEPVYVLGTTRRADEGIVGHDLRVRPLRLGKGDYTMVVAPDDVKDQP